MLRIEFEYRDEMSRWEWRKQSCTCRSVEEAKRFYGLGERVGSLSEIDDAKAPPHAFDHSESSSVRRGLLHSGEAGSDAASRDASLLSTLHPLLA